MAVKGETRSMWTGAVLASFNITAPQLL